MTEHDERPSEEKTAQSRDEGDPDLRPLPDGGLGENMPEWLRRPPAWRELPGAGGSTSISELVAATVTEVVAASVPEVQLDLNATAREIPPIDTSVIDPKSLIDFEDLPVWLQELGSKRASAVVSADDTGLDAEQKIEAGDDVVALAPESNVSSTEHLTVSAAEQSVQAVKIAAEPPRELAVWQQGPFIAVLVVALLVAIVLAILYGTGTF
ncbi:MAG: hypothetical protein ACR2OU_20445 [Thermomicrobiales bacterium]